MLLVLQVLSFHGHLLFLHLQKCCSLAKWIELSGIFLSKFFDVFLKGDGQRGQSSFYLLHLFFQTFLLITIVVGSVMHGIDVVQIQFDAK